MPDGMRLEFGPWLLRKSMHALAGAMAGGGLGLLVAAIWDDSPLRGQVRALLGVKLPWWVFPAYGAVALATVVLDVGAFPLRGRWAVTLTGAVLGFASSAIGTFLCAQIANVRARSGIRDFSAVDLVHAVFPLFLIAGMALGAGAGLFVGTWQERMRWRRRGAVIGAGTEHGR